jgi:hypothetical protein
MKADVTTTILPFGKYKGRPVTEAETTYLRWLVTEIGRAKLNQQAAGLGDAVLYELSRREADHLRQCQEEAAERRKDARRAMRAGGWTIRPGNRKVPVLDLEPSEN